MSAVDGITTYYIPTHKSNNNPLLYWYIQVCIILNGKEEMEIQTKTKHNNKQTKRKRNEKKKKAKQNENVKIMIERV